MKKALGIVLILVLVPLLYAQEYSDSNTTEYFKTATIESVKRYLRAGADVNARNENGGTPLHGAASNNENPEVITILLDAGADPKAETTTGETVWDVIQDNEALKDTEAYWRLNDLQY